MVRAISTRTISNRKWRIWNACPKTCVIGSTTDPPTKESRSEYGNGCRRSSNGAPQLRGVSRRRRRIVILVARKSKKHNYAPQRQHSHDQDAPFRAGCSAAEDRVALRMRSQEMMLHHKSAVGHPEKK